MGDSSDQPTRKSESPPTPLEAETRDAPPAPEPGTATDQTHSHDADPRTASLPQVLDNPLWVEPPGFVILRELGSGGMGIVYEARQTKLNRRVALKMLRGTRGDTQSVIRFLAEAEAVAAIKHPHVVQVYEIGQGAGSPFMALELLTGGTLSDQLRARQRFDPRDAAALVAKLADAVQTAHDLGIVHRDLKPSNVLFDEAGVPKITDFGLAKRTGSTGLTQTQAVMGTPAYMAPEQARGETRFVGTPADIWALGAILYELLTGKRAFDAEDTWAILRKVTDEPPPAPRMHVPGLPCDLELIALKCLEKNPADRYPSAAALGADLENYLAGRPVSVRPAGPRERFVKWCRRNPVVAGFTAALLVVGLLGFAGVTWGFLRAEERGNQLAKSNDDLGNANTELKRSRDEQAALAGVLKTARDNLATQAGELTVANEAAAERGYLSDIALAHELWKANDLRGMRAALERCPPARRRWEWHYLDRLSRPEREVIATDSVPLAMAYSSDGTRLAWLTKGGTLTVRELATSREQSFTVDGEVDFARTLAFRSGGSELAFSAGSRVWRVELNPWKVEELTPMRNGKPVRGDTIQALVYAKDGSLLGAVSPYPKLKAEWKFSIRNLRTGKDVATLSSGVITPLELVVSVGGAAFSPDGTRFAASFVDSGIRVSRVGEVEKWEQFRSTVLAWDIASGQRLVETSGGTIFGGLAFSTDGRSVTFSDGILAVERECRHDVKKVGEEELTFKGTQWVYHGHTAEVFTAVRDKNGLLWSGGRDKFIRGRGPLNSETGFVLRGCPDTVMRLAVSPDGKEVAAAVGDMLGGNGAVNRFNIAALDGDMWRAPVAPTRFSAVVALSSDGSRFTATDFGIGGAKQANPKCFIRDTFGGTEHPLAPTNRVLHGISRPDGGIMLLDQRNERSERVEFLRLIGADGKSSGTITLPAVPSVTAPSVLACSERTVAAVQAVRANKVSEGGRAARVLTWNVASHKPGRTLEADFTDVWPPRAKVTSIQPAAAAFDAAGGRLAAVFTLIWQKPGRGEVDFRGAVIVWDIRTGEEVFRQITQDPMRVVGFALDGTLVSAGGSTSGGIVYGWNVEAGTRAFVIHGHTRPVLALAFGPDGRLATGGADRTVKLWDLVSRREILTLDGFAREVVHLAFTKDGKNLVAATGLDMLAVLSSVNLPPEWPPAEVRIFRGPK